MDAADFVFSRDCVCVDEALKETLLERLHYYVKSVDILRARELADISWETAAFLICFE